MNPILTILASIILGLYSGDTAAQLFKLNVTDYGGLSAPERTILDRAITEAETEINSEFPSAEDPKRLMQGMANSSVFAGKGIGSDYASYMDVFLIGGGIGVGADLEKDEQTESDLSGAGIQGGLIIGTNLSWMDTQKILGLDTNRLSVYVNYLGLDIERELGDKGNDSIEAGLRSLGVHFRYSWLTGAGPGWFRWGGLKFHTGYEYNMTKLTFNTTLSEVINEDLGGGQSVSGTIRGRPAATIDVATQSIPFEISTDLRMFYFLSLYTGLGVDFNFGKAKGDGSLNADPTTLDYTAGSDPTVQAEANIDGSGSVDSVTSRAFLGVQLNLPFLRVFAQANKALGSEVIGATAGLRIVY